ncbi:MAG: hypothetical protein HKN42_05625 [Granulosicoccus sp.]|nr:hypothetical protein [Granulosicoccus sp.]
MSRLIEQRYDDIAVLFHWTIALLIIGLLVIGKYMVSLDENDPVRFVLTQWHKSFGISVLLVSVLRLVWRFTHKPPPEPAGLPDWQKRLAALVHWLLYALMLVIPITGWIMVSASPLNIDTVLFNVIEWPHLSAFETLDNREEFAHAFADYHEIAGNLLLVLLLAHIGAALKHHFVDKDITLVRMLPDWASSAFKRKLASLAAIIAAGAAAMYLYADAGNQAALLAAGDSEVSFVAEVMGETSPGLFTDTSVEALIDEAQPAGSTIVARVQTASVSSDNAQMQGSLPDTEWFDVQNHPEALFESTSVTAADDGSLQVSGRLTIKQHTQDITFPMILTDEQGKRVARGEFTIDRREFDIGLESNDSDDFVAFPVLVKFRFDITPANT